MAKIETPAEAGRSPVRPPRPARRAGPLAATSLPLDALALDASEVSALAASSLAASALAARSGAARGVPPVGPKPDGRGPAVARSRAASEARFASAIADEDVTLEADEAPETERQSQVPPGQYLGADAEPFGLPRPRGAAKVPMANLEKPSSPRLDLTPSPVPRVALSPATGSVDISLVPGPYASRNMPTLAAQHALGRRQRRPAPARTLPPPSRASREAHPARLATDVRSSKREIVLGLTIGLGLSLVLAAIGQNYLRQDPIASVPDAQELESLTLSARPRLPAAEGVVAEASAAAMPGAVPTDAVHTDDAPTDDVHTDVERYGAEAADPSRAERGREPARALASHRSADGAAASGPSGYPAGTFIGRSKVDLAGHGARGGTGSMLVSSAGAHATGSHPARSVATSDPAAFEAGKSSEEAPPDRPRMSPAESAGLGLDLPL